MKVVLRQDVEKVGERGEVISVTKGFARNYLLPKGLAFEATPGNLRMLELQKKAWAAREAKEVEEAQAFAERLGAISIEVTKKAGENDTLYGSVTSTEIGEKLAEQGFDLDRRKIQIAEPIKSLGEFRIPIRIHRQVVAEVTLRVVAETE